MADEEAPKAPAEKADKAEKAPAKLATEVSASGGHAVVVAQPAPTGGPSMPQVSRRGVVIFGFWSAMTAMLGGIVFTIINSLWSRTAQRLGGQFVLDFNANDLAPGEKRPTTVLVPNPRNPLENLEAQVFVVRLNEEQAARNPSAEGKAGAYLALSRKCPHLGCTVPYEEGFSFVDPLDGTNITGWFRCPCHGSTYSDAGRRVFGPAPRSMDVYALTVAEDGTMTIDLSTQFQGSPDNAVHAVLPGEAQA